VTSYESAEIVTRTIWKTAPASEERAFFGTEALTKMGAVIAAAITVIVSSSSPSWSPFRNTSTSG
jgi:hypothetical protein